MAVDQALSPARWPDFIILGAMKAGTTTLFDWLGQGDDVALPQLKEPGHLAREVFGRGERTEYRSLFATPLLTGEASVRYGWPWEAERVARRIAVMTRRPKLLFLARDPEVRLRSDYRHGVPRGRERRPFGEVVADPSEPVVRRSVYSETLGCYRSVLGHPPFTVRSEDLFGADVGTWDSVVAHLGLSPRSRPTNVRNRTSDRPATTALGRALLDRPSTTRALRRAQAASEHLPSTVRALGRRLLQAERGGGVDDLLATADGELPPDTASVLRAERRRLDEEWGLRW